MASFAPNTLASPSHLSISISPHHLGKNTILLEIQQLKTIYLQGLVKYEEYSV